MHLRHTAPLLLVCVIALLPAMAQGNDPIADPRAVINAGQARITILTPQLVRLEWSPDKKFVDYSSFVFVNRRMPVPHFVRSLAGDTIVVRTDALEIRYVATRGKFSGENLQIRFLMNGNMKTWKPGMIDGGNLKGRPGLSMAWKDQPLWKTGCCHGTAGPSWTTAVVPCWIILLALGHGQAGHAECGLVLLRLRTCVPQGIV